MASTINATTSGAGGVITTADNSGILQIQGNGTTGLTVSSSGVSFPNTINASNTFGFKNRLINGNFIISQYNGTNSVAPGGNQYPIDRWYTDTYGSAQNGYTVQQLSASPPAGFNNYVQIQANSTTYTNINFSQTIESINSVDLLGQTVTVSFWYKVPVNWTSQWNVGVSYNTSNNAKVYGGNGTSISSVVLANTTTWTKASLTVTVPSNALSLGVIFNNGNNNVINGAQFQLTGVQLELGSQATSFDFRSIGTELALCQRYFQTTINSTGPKAGWSGVGTGNYVIYTNPNQFKVPMRAAPTMVLYAYSQDAGNTPVGDGRTNSGTTAGFMYYNAGSPNYPTATYGSSTSTNIYGFGVSLGENTVSVAAGTGLGLYMGGYTANAEL